MSEGRVVVAMSGGVDSSVAAAFLREQGYDVIGLFMRTGSHEVSEDRRSKTCCSVADAADARRVADRLDIPFYALDFEQEFGRIVDRFVDDYFSGRTPNPCVLCNVWLKFGKLWAYGRAVGAEYVATGHYARTRDDDHGRKRLCRAKDRRKDQSYVLSGLRTETLAHVLFPLGEMEKPRVREYAQALGLPVHDKPESQEICFVPDNDYVSFIRERRPESSRPGRFEDLDGNEIGRHEGIEAYTVGQRRGLGLSVGAPRFVVSIEPASATVRVGPREATLADGLEAAEFNWHGEIPAERVRCRAQIRARHEATPAWAERGSSSREVRVWFDEPQPAVAPGQVVTLYDTADETVLGGGWIERRLERLDEPAIERQKLEVVPRGRVLD